MFCQAIPITCHSENDQWHHLSQTELDSWNSCIYSTEMAQEPTIIFTSHLNYATVVRCNLSKLGQKVENLADASRPIWVAKECQSWQIHLSNWCYGKTWLGKITKVSQLSVIFWFNSLYISGIQGRTFNLSLSITCSMLSAIFTKSHVACLIAFYDRLVLTRKCTSVPCSN